MPNKPRSSLNSGLHVLECIAQRKQTMTLTELASALGMSKSSVHQLLGTLARRGYVNRLSDQSYRLGIKAWEIGCVAAPMELTRTASPHMAQLVRDLSDGVSLAILDGAEMVCVHLIESPRAVRVHTNVGDRTPAHCISSGLAILSAMDNDAVVRLLPETLPAATASTITDRESLLRELARVRLRGYAFCRGAWRADVAGISVPVRGPDNRAAAALCVAVPLFRATREWVTRTVPLLQAAAGAVEQDMLYSAAPVGAVGRIASASAG
jgi:DNA-binding IclR family transcriptional regulator